MLVGATRAGRGTLAPQLNGHAQMGWRERRRPRRKGRGLRPPAVVGVDIHDNLVVTAVLQRVQERFQRQRRGVWLQAQRKEPIRFVGVLPVAVHRGGVSAPSRALHLSRPLSSSADSHTAALPGAVLVEEVVLVRRVDLEAAVDLRVAGGLAEEAAAEP